MPMIDPQTSDLSKLTASLVRDARSLLRRADKLASAVGLLCTAVVGPVPSRQGNDS